MSHVRAALAATTGDPAAKLVLLALAAGHPHQPTAAELAPLVELPVDQVAALLAHLDATALAYPTGGGRWMAAVVPPHDRDAETDPQAGTGEPPPPWVRGYQVGGPPNRIGAEPGGRHRNDRPDRADRTAPRRTVVA